MSDIKVLALVGSLRAASINRQIAELAAETALRTASPSRSSTGWASCRSTTRTSTTMPTSPAAVGGAARRGGRSRCRPGGDPGIQRQHPRRWSRTRSTGCRGPFGDGALKDKPLAVIGGALGRYGGVWAHDETRKSFGIAGPRVVEDHQAVGAVPNARRQASARRTPNCRERARRGRQTGRRSRLTAHSSLGGLCWPSAALLCERVHGRLSVARW